jgi:succinate dehydrogenase/fumarate reductase flavoprotein subunit
VGSDIQVQEQTMIVSLLVEDGTCRGAIGIGENGGNSVFKAAATVLGTGGNGQLFERNLHPSCVTGDGYAMGYEAGAELMNMEFNQIFQGTVYPTINMLTAGWMWPYYPRITNGNGEEFIQNYLPEGTTVKECMDQRARHFPFSTRDTLSKYIDIAIIKEILAGRGNQHNGVYIDLTDPKINIPPASREFYEYRGVDMTREPVEVSIFLHCSNGGLVIDENAQTTTPGLFAAGEVAAGPHGADRLGGNMLAASQVFGKRAGRHAAEWAKQTGVPSVAGALIGEHEQRIVDLEESDGDRTPSELTQLIQKLAWENMLLTRSKDNLNTVLEGVEQIRNELMPRLTVSNATQLVEAFELQNRLQVAEIMARPALLREESRGGHYREDFPERDDGNWLQAITIEKGAAGRLEIGGRVVDPDWQDREGDMGARRWG